MSYLMDLVMAHPNLAFCLRFCANAMGLMPQAVARSFSPALLTADFPKKKFLATMSCWKGVSSAAVTAVINCGMNSISGFEICICFVSVRMLSMMWCGKLNALSRMRWALCTFFVSVLERMDWSRASDKCAPAGLSLGLELPCLSQNGYGRDLLYKEYIQIMMCLAVVQLC